MAPLHHRPHGPHGPHGPGGSARLVDGASHATGVLGDKEMMLEISTARCRCQDLQELNQEVLWWRWVEGAGGVPGCGDPQRALEDGGGGEVWDSRWLRVVVRRGETW